MDRIDYLAVANSLAWLPAEPIGSFRKAHYPTAHLLEPHLTVVFPVPAAIGMDVVSGHVRDVASRTQPFDIRLGGLGKSWDHWLFLAVAEGREQVIALHDALYTGVLAPHLWTDEPYIPHVGLGHFAEERDTRDPLTLGPGHSIVPASTRPGGRPRRCSSTTPAASTVFTSSGSTRTSLTCHASRKSRSADHQAGVTPVTVLGLSAR